jgi:phosphohistidine phosphatase
VSSLHAQAWRIFTEKHDPLIVHLLRHAKTEVSSISGRDFDRRLAPKGHQQCVELQKIVQTNISSKTNILCSSANRTKETAAIVFDEGRSIDYFESLYLSDLSGLLAFIWKQESDTDMLIIGHNFGISELASYVTGKQVGMRTCGFVSIDFKSFTAKEVSNSNGALILNHRCTIDF